MQSALRRQHDLSIELTRVIFVCGLSVELYETASGASGDNKRLLICTAGVSKTVDPRFGAALITRRSLVTGLLVAVAFRASLSRGYSCVARLARTVFVKHVQFLHR